MNKQEIITLQKRIGTVPDGFWGPKSTAQAKKYLRDMMPNPNPWPATNESSLKSFYGKVCDEDQLINMKAPVPMFFEGKRVKTLRVHKKVGESLEICLVLAYAIEPDIISVYDGIYNCRNIGGGSTPSLHARGAAIDIHAQGNGNKTHWPVGAFMPIEVMEIFAKEGWTSGGAFWSRDAMHMQATKP